MRCLSPRSAAARLDLHVHSTASADGESSIADHARRALALGLEEVGFCEHVDLDPRDRHCAHLDLARYSREIARVREEAPGVRWRQGIEISYQSRNEDEIRAWLEIDALDYVVTSLHVLDYADGWSIVSEPRMAGRYFRSHDQRQAYGPYFQEMLRAAHSGLGDILGHLDLVKRYGTAYYGPFEPDLYREAICDILQAAIQQGMAVEVNTSGWRQAPGEPYPSPTILTWYRQLGGERLTIGSDAHRADHLGEGVARAQDLLRQIGFRAVATFERRQARWLDL